MDAWFTELSETLGAYPILQGAVAAFATFILEDPTTVSCGLLVADGKMAFLTALIGVSLGIALGDFGLYLIGRLVGPKAVAWGLLSPGRLHRAKTWFDRNLVLAVVVSRFLPGMRLPTYVGAGFLRASPSRFLAVAMAASLVWTFLLLAATIKIGEVILPVLGDLKWPVAIALVAVLIVVQRAAARKADTEPVAEPVASPFEFWPPAVFYFPVGVYYAWLALRHRSISLPTAANPSIYMSGLIGESKAQILSLVPESHRHWVAPWTTYTPSAGEGAEERCANARERIDDAGLAYPLVAKPDVGQRGAGVQVLRSNGDLRTYLAAFPSGTALVLQALATGVQEAGIFYYRMPDSEEGTIFSITLKEFPSILGDGESTIRELIQSHPRAQILQHVFLRRHAEIAEDILESGATFPLVFAGNHAQGTVFRDGTHLVTPEMLRAFEDISAAIPEFYFGRFDVRFDDFDAFLRGEEFTIVEINGAGSEATHIWDPGMRLIDAYRALFRQFRVVFEIGAVNRRRGHRPLGVATLLRECWRYRLTSRAYPVSH
jgi:membrane protein DedA with SNARE-associated domain